MTDALPVVFRHVKHRLGLERIDRHETQRPGDRRGRVSGRGGRRGDASRAMGRGGGA